MDFLIGTSSSTLLPMPKPQIKRGLKYRVNKTEDIQQSIAGDYNVTVTGYVKRPFKLVFAFKNDIDFQAIWDYVLYSSEAYVRIGDSPNWIIDGYYYLRCEDYQADITTSDLLKEFEIEFIPV